MQIMDIVHPFGQQDVFLHLLKHAQSAEDYDFGLPQSFHPWRGLRIFSVRPTAPDLPSQPEIVIHDRDPRPAFCSPRRGSQTGWAASNDEDLASMLASVTHPSVHPYLVHTESDSPGNGVFH
jgi:hypothetical protein